MTHLKRHIVLRFLFLAIGVILSMHQVIPHHHHSQVVEETHWCEHEQAKSFWEYLQLAFHQELGNDDLTTSITKAERMLLNSSTFCLPTIFDFTLEAPTKVEITAFRNSEEITYKSYFYLLSNQFRDPPLA